MEWGVIRESWMTDKWKKSSKNGAENRKKVPGVESSASLCVTHTGGSINFDIHHEREETKRGDKVSEIEMFTKLHKKEKGKGEWCDVRSASVVAKYNDVIKQKHSLESPEDLDDIDPVCDVPFDSQAWLEATGAPKKNKVYGFGVSKEAEFILSHTKCSSSTKRSHIYTAPPIDIESTIEAEVKARVESQMGEFKLMMTRQVQEQVKQLLASQQTTLHSSTSLGHDNDNP